MKKKTSVAILIVLSILFGTIIYSYLRYILFGKFNTDNNVVFILNKTFIFSAVLLIPFMIQTKYKLYRYLVDILVVLHIGISLYSLSPGFYPQFFDSDNMLNVWGISVVSFGSIAGIFFFNAIAKQFIEISKRWNSVFFLLFVIAHNVALDYSGWFNFDHWYGGLPPISLLTSIVLVYSLVLVLIQPLRKKS